MKKKDVELVFKGADEKSWQELLDDLRPQGERAERALSIVDRLTDSKAITIRERGTLRRAILLPERPQVGWVRREDVIHSIARQYSEHNELVPIWLHIGDIKGGEEE